MDASSYQTKTVVSNELIGDQVRYLKIDAGKDCRYEAGQFVMMRLKHESGDFVERSYSMANFDETGHLEFVIRIEEMGKMSSIIDILKPGDEIDVKGPFGKFGFADVKEPIQKLVLIAGGVGISPIRSMVQKSMHEGADYPIQLFYGFRTPNDFLFQEELQGHADGDRLAIIPAISEEDPNWDGKKGFISDCLEGEVFEPSAGVHCFICGPPPMVKATRSKLFELGFERPQVHVEAW